MPAFTSLYFGLQSLVENMSSEFGGVNDSMIDSIAIREEMIRVR